MDSTLRSDPAAAAPSALPTAPTKAEPTKAEPASAAATAPAPAPVPMTTTAPRARIIVRRDSQEAKARGETQHGLAAVPAPAALPPHDWEALERRKKLAQARAAQSGKRLHAAEERRQAHLETLKKEVLRAEAVEAPLQPTFYTPAKSRGSGAGGGAGSRRSSFGDRLCPPKEHLHQRSQSREQRSQQLDLRGCTFQPVIFTRPPRKHHHPKAHHPKRGGSVPAAPVAAGGAGPHKDDDSVSSLSSGSAAGAAAGGHGRRSSGPSVFDRNHEFGQIYNMRREKRREELRKAEAESLPFTPQILSRASSPGPQQAPAPANPEVFFERIKARLNALEEKKKQDKEQRELRGCSFQPKTNNGGGARSHRQQHTAGAQPFYERLYNQAHARRLSLEELKRRHVEQELRECTFDPFLLKQQLGYDPYFEQAQSVVAAAIGSALDGRPRQRSASTPAAPVLLPPGSPSSASASIITPRKTTIHDLLAAGGTAPAAIVIKGGAVAVKPPTPLSASAPSSVVEPVKEEAELDEFVGAVGDTRNAEVA